MFLEKLMQWIIGICSVLYEIFHKGEEKYYSEYKFILANVILSRKLEILVLFRKRDILFYVIIEILQLFSCIISSFSRGDKFVKENDIPYTLSFEMSNLNKFIVEILLYKKSSVSTL